MINFFSTESKFPLIPSVRPSPSTKKVFLQLSAWDNELSPKPKITTFLAKPLSKLHERAPSNVIP